MTTANKVHCSFCNRGNAHPEVDFMIAEKPEDPRSAAICGECLDICVDIRRERHERQLDEIQRLGT